MSLKAQLQVLVVDDMSTSRGVILQALDAMGLHNVHVAHDGRSALSVMREKRIHLVLSDFHMPDMNGIDLLRTIRNIPPLHNIGFILVTGRATVEMVAEGQKFGLNNLLRKPFTPQALQASIEAVAGRL